MWSTGATLAAPVRPAHVHRHEDIGCVPKSKEAIDSPRRNRLGDRRWWFPARTSRWTVTGGLIPSCSDPDAVETLAGNRSGRTRRALAGLGRGHGSGGTPRPWLGVWRSWSPSRYWPVTAIDSPWLYG